MNKLSGELLQIDLYSRGKSDADFMASVVLHLLSTGGEFAGRAVVYQASGARNAPFQGIHDDPARQRELSTHELLHALRDADSRVVQVEMWSALGITKEVPELITYAGISGAAATLHEQHPVSIVSEAWVFGEAGDEHSAALAGKTCYEKFHGLCKSLHPTYSAIMCEHSLPCLYDLRQGAGNECFVDFFLNATAFTDSVYKQIPVLFQAALIEQSDNGIFVLASGDTVPGGARIPWNALVESSSAMASVIRQSSKER